jgi:hypothetical protein
MVDGELLYGEDQEVFRVTTTRTGRIHARTTGPLTPPREPVVKLISDCSSKAELQITSEATGITTPVLPPGTYYLSVTPWRPNYLGRFTLHVEFKEARTEVTQEF